MTTTIYLAGPMSGIPGLNFPAFNAEAKRLRSLGYRVINPAELNGADANLVSEINLDAEQLRQHWRSCMRVDIAHLMFCDAVALLPGWERSKGACLEEHVAKQLDMSVHMSSDLVAAAFHGSGCAVSDGLENIETADKAELLAQFYQMAALRDKALTEAALYRTEYLAAKRKISLMSADIGKLVDRVAHYTTKEEPELVKAVRQSKERIGPQQKTLGGVKTIAGTLLVVAAFVVIIGWAVLSTGQESAGCAKRGGLYVHGVDSFACVTIGGAK